MLALLVNGRRYEIDCPEDSRLLDVLREKLGLTSVREACGVGACGACTVLLDGNPINSCLVFAFRCENQRIETIEARGNELSIVQQAFLECGALQCGYCTPGFVLSAEALLAQNPAPADDEIREYLAGNLCRCGAYLEILAAVRQASMQTRAYQRAARPVVCPTSIR
jgi:aerobic-type carbon monoxide dehydrogenase small subunit (CoxS/CutS family)